MARPVRFHREAQSRFSNLFTGLCQRKSSWEVWADFVSMVAISISNAVDREGKTHDDREKQYLRTIQGYNQTEQQVFPKLFAMLVEALEDEPDQDFLGEMFMGLNLGSHWKGQFFTPYNVCRMMAEMQADGIEERVQRQGWISVNDPCCGAGALPWLTAMVGLPWTAHGTVCAFYLNLAKSDHREGGITFECAKSAGFEQCRDSKNSPSI